MAADDNFWLYLVILAEFLSAICVSLASIFHDFARRALLCQPLVCFGCSAAGTQAGLCVSLSPHSHTPLRRSTRTISWFVRTGARLMVCDILRATVVLARQVARRTIALI